MRAPRGVPGYQRLAGLEDAFCYITQISGKLFGSGEEIRLRAGNTHWYLEVEGYQNLRATAQCVYYDQSQ